MKRPHAHHWLERQDVDDVTVVHVKVPQLGDDETTQDLFHQMYALVDDVKRHKLVLELTAVRYLASMALGKLILLNRKAQVAGGRLALCGLTPAVAQILEVAHLNDRFDIYPGDQQALASFGE
jgi:anti-sigma B factor antagonist